jgi:methyl-accepting chemotaxis protein
MANKAIRKPVGNFFIKKTLQIGLIMKVVAASLASVVISSASLLLVYYYKFDTIAVYTWNQDTNGLDKKSMIDLILPPLSISVAISILVAFGIGLYASRKYAVPIFKIEQWVSMLLGGKMTAILRFREQEEMKELTQKCNELGSFLRGTMVEIKEKVKAMQDAGIQNKDLDSIAAKLDTMELSSGPIEIKSPVGE